MYSVTIMRTWPPGSFQANGLALDHVLVPDLAADLGKDRDAVRVPLAEHRAGLDLGALLDQQIGAGRDLVFFDFAALGSKNKISPLRVNTTC